ncbi:hypothetical protein SeLEV6574_g01223 [Synchytrium endobioticum]|nr:hypothetical protein SeLEV6574_g01223 [Synchytrium endobioticum]
MWASPAICRLVGRHRPMACSRSICRLATNGNGNGNGIGIGNRNSLSSIPGEWPRRPPPKYDEELSSDDVSPFHISPPVRPSDEPPHVKRARLLYMSRKRGILETDLLLSTFAKDHLPTMSMQEMAHYDALLEENDWDIYYWATAARKIPQRVMRDGLLMRKLMDHAKNKKKSILRMPDL